MLTEEQKKHTNRVEIKAATNNHNDDNDNNAACEPLERSAWEWRRCSETYGLCRKGETGCGHGEEACE